MALSTWSLDGLDFRLEQLEIEAEKIRKEIYRRLAKRNQASAE